MSHTIYIYGTEVHDDYQAISYRRTEAAAWESAGDGGQGYPWVSLAITCIEDCRGNELYERMYTTAGDRIIAAQIARALIRKRRERNAYKAPTLATLWPPTGA